MLTLLQAELAVFVVQGVGGSDIDGLYLRVGGKGFVRVIAAGDAVLLRKRLCACLLYTSKSIRRQRLIPSALLTAYEKMISSFIISQLLHLSLIHI